MENIIWSFLIVIMVAVFTYKATKNGMIDDAWSFIKNKDKR
jgi:hypothetical protein